MTTGSALEKAGADLFLKLGVRCVGDLKHVHLRDLDPEGIHRKGDHLEIDYLIPHGEVCLVGEITSRRSSKDLRKKYLTSCKHLEILSGALSRATTKPLQREFFSMLGVPDSELKWFRDIKHLFGFFIATERDRAHLDIDVQSRFPILYQQDWKVLEEYVEAIGIYAANTFLERVGMKPIAKLPTESLSFKGEKDLLVQRHKLLSLAATTECDVLVFAINPYKLLDRAQVYRRESISQELWEDVRHYQRALSLPKLKEIRTKLLSTSSDFMFPTSILIVLAAGSHFNSNTQALSIPNEYGALHVIDGQHRLFAYAQSTIKEHVADDAAIMVTAIHLPDASPEVVQRFCASAFVEINANQTAISPLLLHDIAFDVLGERTPKAISAKILAEANRRRNGKLRGRLRTIGTPTGPIKITELVSSLAQIANTERVNVSIESSTARLISLREGYEHLFCEGNPCDLLLDGAELMKAGERALTRYFNGVATTFPDDWDDVLAPKPRTSLRRTKMIGGFIRLFKEFLEEGLDWDEVLSELARIHANVSALGNRTGPKIVFDESAKELPNPTYRQMDFYRFLSRNRSRKTRIQTVVSRN